MTEPPLDPVDELASAHLDEAAAPEEAERAIEDPDVAARVREFAAVRRTLRATPAPVAPATRDSAIRAALAAYDDERAGATGRRRRVVRADAAPRAGRPAWARAVGVAAAVVLLAAVVPVLVDGDHGDDDRATTAAEDVGRPSAAPGAANAEPYGGAEADTSSAAPPAGGGAGSAAPADAEALAATADIPHLGGHDDVATLAERVRRQLDGPGEPEQATAPPPPAVATCLARAIDAAVARAGAVVLMATATLGGRSTTVVVTEVADEGRTLLVLDHAAGCRTLADQRL
jgi:hypothetical protein